MAGVPGPCLTVSTPLKLHGFPTSAPLGRYHPQRITLTVLAQLFNRPALHIDDLLGGMHVGLQVLGMVTPAASSSRRRPSRPRASPRSRASACDLRGAVRQRSQPRRIGRRCRRLQGAANDNAIGEYVIVVVAPLAETAPRGADV